MLEINEDSHINMMKKEIESLTSEIETQNKKIEKLEKIVQTLLDDEEEQTNGAIHTKSA
jgi:prefoldin subunit 5